MKMQYLVGSALYSCGPGQILGIPTTLISGSISAVFGIRQLICHIREQRAEDIVTIENFKNKKAERKQAAIEWAAITTLFACCMIPVAGGPIGFYTATVIKPLPPEPSSGHYY